MLVRKILDEITIFGGIFFYAFVMALFYFSKDYNNFLILFSGLALIYVITFLIRIVYFKPRPKKVKYNNYLEKIDASAFPSIHSARIVFLFLLLVFNFSSNLLAILLGGVFTLLTIYSRIFLKKHFYVDVIGGIILGILTFGISYLLF